MVLRELVPLAKFAAQLSRILTVAGWFVVFSHTLAAVTLDRAVTLRGTVPATCGDFLTNPPASVTSFALSDAFVTVVFSVSGGKAGDVAAVTYVTPAGQVYAPASGPWPGLTAAEAAMAHVCFIDTNLPIAGTSVASTPGTWSVRISVNNVVLTTLTFTIGATAPTCAYSLSASSASPASAAATGAFQVTTGSGCAWTAASNAIQWLTVTSGSPGSGSGTVGWAVTANSGVAPRAGTIMVTGGAQIFAYTVTQSGTTSTGGIAISLAADPVTVTDSLFYYTNLASLTNSGVYSGFDMRDSFGGTFTSFANEIGHTIFSDSPPLSGYYSAQFQTKTPVQLSSYALYLGDDGTDNPASRSATRATILAGAAPGSLSVIGDTNIVPLGSTYNKTFGGTPVPGRTFAIKLAATLAGSPTYQYFELRLYPNNGAYPGVRILEFAGSGTASGGACAYSLNPASATPAAGAGTGSFQVAAGPGCAWTASSSVTGWLTVTGSASGSGNGTVNYAVTANTGTASRTGTITVQDKTFTVTQAGATTGGGAMFPIDLSPYVNDDTRNYSGYPVYPTGAQTFLSVPFLIPSISNGWNAWRGAGSGASVLGIPLGVTNATSVYFILNTIWGVPGNPSDPSTSKASITFAGTGGITYTRNLYGNVDVRDYNSGSYANSINGTTTQNVWSDGNHRLDVMRVDLPASFANTSLLSITLTDLGADGVQRLLLKGITVASGTGGTPTCSYALSPTSASPGSAATTGSFQVTAGSGCAWTATSNSTSWLTVTGGSTGSGSGTVSYSVTANPGTASRTGNITVDNKNFTLTQAGAIITPGNCTYDLSVSGSGKMSLPGEGANSAIYVSTQTGCPWTATTDSPGWISITKGQSGTGNGEVDFVIPANPNITPRTGTMTIAAKTVIMAQGAGKPADGAPAVKSVANAASQASASLPSGGIAQGAIFCLTGSNLGPGDPADPATGVKAGVLPLTASLGGVSVQVKQGSNTIAAYPVFAWAGRVDAVMPSNVPLGAVTITLTYKGVTSLVAAATVVATNFGAYATSGSSGGRAVLMVQASAADPGVQNSNSLTAKPGQTVTLIGTGLGAISGPDNSAPPIDDMPVSVQILVGTQAVTPLHAGRLPGQPGKDRIQFQVPADAPSGCNLPVQVVTNGALYSNVVTMAVDANGQTCVSLNPWTGMAEKGGKLANIMLIRAQASPTSSTGEVKPFLLDEAAAWITSSTAGGFSMLNMLASIPALGTCGTLGGGALNLSSASGMPPGAVGLDAGPALTLASPVGARSMSPSKNQDDTPEVGMYGLTGQGGSTDAPPFVEPGAYTLSGQGGKDVGPFTANFTIPQPLLWTNKETVTLDRTAGGLFTWSGGTDAQYVVLAGGGVSADGQASVGFICFVPATPGTFTVPASVLANLPVPDPAQNGQNAGLVFGVVPAVQTHFTAPGLDDGVVFYGLFQASYGGVK